MEKIDEYFEKAVFLSDAHLGTGDDDKKRENVLIDFLSKEINEKVVLFIIGDLFDFWFEYKNAIPKGHYRLIAKLIELVNSGTKIYYIAGNHDFWTGNFFKREIGIEFHSEALKVEIYGKKLYIAHGDGIKRKDWGYRLLKKIFRNRINIFLYRWLHPDFGIPFAKMISKASRDYSTERDYGSDLEYFEFAKKKFKEGFDAVILAHTHRPYFKKVDSKYYVNIGDWLVNFSYLEINKDKFQLKYKG